LWTTFSRKEVAILQILTLMPAGGLKSQPSPMRGSRLSTAADASSTRSPQNQATCSTRYSGAATLLNNWAFPCATAPPSWRETVPVRRPSVTGEHSYTFQQAASNTFWKLCSFLRTKPKFFLDKTANELYFWSIFVCVCKWEWQWKKYHNKLIKAHKNSTSEQKLSIITLVTPPNISNLTLRTILFTP